MQTANRENQAPIRAAALNKRKLIKQPPDINAKSSAASAIESALRIPNSWRDLRVGEYPSIGASCLCVARVIDTRDTDKIFIARLFSQNWRAEVSAVYFHAKSWQKAQYTRGAILNLYGKVERGRAGLEIIQPIAVKTTGAIEPQYKNKAAKAAIAANVGEQKLIAEGLPIEIAKELINLHFPRTMPSLDNAKTIYALKYAEIFSFMKRLRRKRLVLSAIATITADPAPFIKSLPFALTDDQLAAIAACRSDLSRDVQARRLIVGDVGCGKTMVMLAIAYMVGKARTILMAPTTLLANQLYEEARNYLGGFLKIGFVTQKEDTIDGKNLLSEPDADFIVGTQALLYRKLPRAACVMIDEQHRFGANQRKKLGDLTSGGGAKPHFFQFSATPIPRTLAMIQSSLLQITTIKTMPFKRRVQTRVIDRNDFGELIAHIREQIALGAQVLIVYPLIEASETNEYRSLEEARGYWESRFDRVYVTHGKDREKEETLLDFRENGAILLATTVVEVGISLPRLNTIVVAGADRLGLATLHQLRGRVGRAGQEARCFFYSNNPRNARLTELAKTNDGFEVAELDLQNRDSGDLLSGVMQSGAQFNWFNISSDRRIVEAVKAALDAADADGVIKAPNKSKFRASKPRTSF
ncbi:MAG: ATP-dependent DNA helicase RecG [Helicobacteraceae bacterium]|nr:ATP-dependent DNA helicase RecG [Helicobacteraceae bacterium]